MVSMKQLFREKEEKKRKKETLRSRRSMTADAEVEKYLTSVFLQLLLDFTEKSRADALFTVPIVLFTVPSSIS